MIFYNVSEMKIIPDSVMRNTRRIYDYMCVIISRDIPYRQVYKYRYGEPMEPLKDIIDVDNIKQLEFAKEYICKNGYFLDKTRIAPSEGCNESFDPIQYRSMEYRYETNNWLRLHKMPMRRKPYVKE